MHSMTTLVAALLAMTSAHTAVLLGAACCRRAAPASAGPPMSGPLCIVIPARNAGGDLAATLLSLTGDRPRVVVADNCDDDTAEVARKHGAEVLERKDLGHIGKGYALQWALPQLLRDRRQFSGFVFVDADTVVHPDFVSGLENALEAGHGAAQGYYQVLDAASDARTAVMACALAVSHYARPLGQHMLGWSVRLTGNGFALSRRTLEQTPWRAVMPLEDLEYTLHLVKAGVAVRFVPEARVWARMPIATEAAARQRTRWEAGRFRLLGLAVEVLGQGLRQRDLGVAFQAAHVIRVPLGELLLLTATGSIVCWLQGENRLAWAFVATLALHLVQVLMALRLARVPFSVVRRLVHAPAYLWWKLSLYPRMWVHGDRWRTGRE